MTSEIKLEANRLNARHSTGPKTASGKARSSRNARRHGLTSAIPKGSREEAQVESLARAILGAAEPCAASWQLALGVASAQYALNSVRRAKLVLLREAEENPVTYVGPHLRHDNRLIRETLKRSLRGEIDIGSPALQDFLYRMRREAPRDHVKRYLELYLECAAELEKFEVYEARALARRRRALRELGAWLGAGCVSCGVQAAAA